MTSVSNLSGGPERGRASRAGIRPYALLFAKLAPFAGALFLVGCSGSDHATSGICTGTVACGFFDIQKTKESTPIFFASAAPSAVYRLCVQTGSVILQTIQADGNASSLGGEIRAGNCAEISFADKVYIIGNTASGNSAGFYYRVP